MSKQHKHHSSPSTARNIVSYIFSFILALVLTAITLLLVVRFGVLSENGVLSIFDRDYYNSMLTYIENQAEYYTLPTGFDVSVLDGVFTDSDLRDNMEAYIHATLSGEDFTPDVSGTQSRLAARAGSYIIESGMVASGDIQEVVDVYAEDILDIYTSLLKIPGMDAFVQIRSTFLKYFLPAIIVLAVIAVLLVLVCIKLHHYKHRGMRYVAYATGGAAVMVFAAPAYVYFSRIYEGLGLQPEYFYYLGVSLISHILLMCIYSAAVWLIITLLLIVDSAVMRKRLINKYK